MKDLKNLHTSVLNSLEEQIAVIDHHGAIVDVNTAWTNFGADNGIASGFQCLGNNYLGVLSDSVARGDTIADDAAKGIWDVLNGNSSSFYSEYPCHSPDEQRWFMMRVTGLIDTSKRLFVVSHQNITQRKLAEERAEHMAMHDPLTGLANRRYFNQFIDREIRRSVRNQSMLSLIMLDVDFFKAYNDGLGHAAGDQCLVNVSKVLQRYSRRPGDLAARLGGDEFALLLAETNVDESSKMAHDIVQAIRAFNMIYDDTKHVTASVGITSMVMNDLQQNDIFLQEADKALYLAKSAGRDRAVHSLEAQEPLAKRISR